MTESFKVGDKVWVNVWSLDIGIFGRRRGIVRYVRDNSGPMVRIVLTTGQPGRLIWRIAGDLERVDAVSQLGDLA